MTLIICGQWGNNSANFTLPLCSPDLVSVGLVLMDTRATRSLNGGQMLTEPFARSDAPRGVRGDRGLKPDFVGVLVGGSPLLLRF